MANYNTTANVVLTVNGKQATQMLSSLEKDAQRLERQIAKAATAGDKATMRKLQRELNSVNRTMDQLRGSASSVDHVLRSLDKATPKELNKALRQLQQQLNGIERGTSAWDAQMAKIKAVKEELHRVNDEMKPDESFFTKINRMLNDWQTAILGIGAALTGLIMAGKSAVQAYADIEQEMANVRKFTGMSAEEVASLNEEFKKINTRSSREDLNKLAQEAGRLGKTSLEDVLGFVRAADKINVALDDLGEGATLTLSKLTGIFGDEKRLGTEKSLLSVGSVINELSQNCSASAPYIAEFASRMGGVGAQAGMTVQQIMAFAAVLDTNNQKLEASSTALSQVIVRIYQDPAKYARVAGMDVERFSNLVKTDMNAVLIDFLSTLKQAGSMDVLSPMFKDMGENGSRAISALSTLANHIQEVKDQQVVANEAFEEATSIDKEFEVQNNTVQAGLDKAKKAFSELAIELGEKLQPVMRYCISSGSAMLRVLKAMVDFFIKYKSEILVITAAIAAYNLIMLVYNTRMTLATRVTTLFHGVLRLFRGVVPIAQMLIAGLTNVIQYFTNGLQVNYAMQQRWRASMEAMKFSSWTGLILALGAAVYTLASKFKREAEEMERARKEAEEWKKSLTDLDEASSEYASKEIGRLDDLYKAATDETKSRDERLAAAQRMQELYPDVFKNLSAEAIMVGQAKTQYDQLRESIINVARARAAADKIKENEGKLLTLEQQAPGLKTDRDNKKKQYDAALAEYNQRAEAGVNTPMMPGAAYGYHVSNRNVNLNGPEAAYQAAERAWQQNQTQQRQLNEANTFLANKYKIAAGQAFEEQADPNLDFTRFGGGGAGGGSGSGGGGGHEDRFAAEKDWRERAEASARISYAMGESNYADYTKEMDRIAVEFCEKQLLHTDLTETERLKITAEYREAQKKQTDNGLKLTAEQEEAAYNQRMAEAKQFYIDGQYSRATYDEAAERIEIEHLQNLLTIYKQGSEDYQRVNQQLQNALIQQTQQRQQKQQELERKYASMKDKFFGDNPQERQAKYDADFQILTEVYNREKAAAKGNAEELLRIEEAFQKAKLALMKQYCIEGAEETRNAMQKGIQDSVDWLNSDGGKAVTGTLDTLVSGMSAVFSGLSTLIQAELEIQTASINKRYDAEISRAEGNTYKVKKLEKEKEAELAKAKKEANRKMFAMQVIQAVAQTATNALNAYGSAAAIPVVGYILAPVAAAMAVAAGAIQIAAIKKQQQASEAQGYKSGGFTPSGKADEVAGVVHKGEWVASQTLVNNPRTRPLLEALDYAQRNNTIGSITAADVSRTITAPAVIAAHQSAASPVVNNTYNTVAAPQSAELTSTLRALNERLNEPFVTVNTVTGDHGIQRAQEEYDRLMKNKSPKSKK